VRKSRPHGEIKCRFLPDVPVEVLAESQTYKEAFEMITGGLSHCVQPDERQQESFEFIKPLTISNNKIML
jgi:hypothetical protein